MRKAGLIPKAKGHRPSREAPLKVKLKVKNKEQLKIKLKKKSLLRYRVVRIRKPGASEGKVAAEGEIRIRLRKQPVDWGKKKRKMRIGWTVVEDLGEEISVLAAKVRRNKRLDESVDGGEGKEGS